MLTIHKNIFHVKNNIYLYKMLSTTSDNNPIPGTNNSILFVPIFYAIIIILEEMYP